ncbi:YfiR family protein [Bordetella bronchialis]|uniref:DUF4154 domain-containing protein n=1 Tax=Bordetella bronchialis TaxID=463025 RepID=A0A193FF64_9BORD|nr:YfiR family protein [Bordetella bronchialis]ANN65749.1 hypothetical protein BAU06_05080 [Bordetella bronchialis]ANN70779.1 hypothetical protein BAU08_05050 [Bordetella bronchialis]
MIGRRAWRFWLPALLAVAHATAGAAPSSTDTATRSALVGQAVMGILGYTRWPVQPDVIRLCVAGQPAYDSALFDDQARPPALAVQVRRAVADDPALAQECDAVYLGGLKPGARRQVLRRIVGHPVVSIVEDDAECAVGSMFCLDVQPDRVGFQVNLDSVARSGVRIHPSVLQLSRRRPSP